MSECLDLIEDDGLVNTFVCNSGLTEEQMKEFQKFLDSGRKTITETTITYHILEDGDYIDWEEE
jgi:hypothetical protein